jgi:hypothetical protein
MVHTIQNLKTSKLNPVFEFHQLLVSLKYVINLVMRIRYTGCHKQVHSFFTTSATTSNSNPDRKGLRHQGNYVPMIFKIIGAQYKGQKQ